MHSSWCATGSETVLWHSCDVRRLQVPSLEIDGHVLAQSNAIIEYLNETRCENG